jgi:hypothetical protein
VAPFSFLRCRPIGVMGMLDQGERDDKVIAVVSQRDVTTGRRLIQAYALAATSGRGRVVQGKDRLT